MAASSSKEKIQLKIHKAARSVHCWFDPPAVARSQIVAYSNAVVVRKTTPCSYFMVCGFPGGYSGVQSLNGKEKMLLFSVWDGSSEMDIGKDDPDKVDPKDRVEVLYCAPFAVAKRFGGEGTGAQCIVKSGSCWEVGVPARFLIRYKFDAATSKTTYSAFFRSDHADKPGCWRHLATFRVNKEQGKFDHGFYSFIEDFRRDTTSVLEEREAQFGPACFLNQAGQWSCATAAKFTASNSPLERPDNIDCRKGSLPGTCTLCTGGTTYAAAEKLGRSCGLAVTDLDVLGLCRCLPFKKSKT